MTVGATQSSTSGASTATSGTSNAVGAMQDQFLKLLITQLQHQDPLNPMDNAQMTTQLAQMSTVEGINKMNDSFASLMSSVQTSQGLQAASMIGRGVMVQGNALSPSGAGAQAGIDLAGSVDSLVVTVSDANGKVVQSMDLGPQKAGFAHFEWDGQDGSGNTLPAGDYTYSVKAAAAGKAVKATPYSVGLVSSVSLSDSGVQLDVQGKGSFAFSAVKQII